MKKQIFKVFLCAVVSLLFFGSQKALAGHDIGTLSKDNPCVFAKFTLDKGEDFYGAFFSVKGKASNVKLSVLNLSKGDVALKTEFADLTNDFEVIETLNLKKGKKEASCDLKDFKDGDSYFIQISEPDFGGLDKMTIGVCVYSEGLGGKKHDFSKVLLSKDELSMKIGKTEKLKATLDKSIKKDGVKWSTSDKKVATVSKKGKVTAKGTGSVIITCTSKKNKDYSAQCTIWIEDGGYVDYTDGKDVVQSGDISDVTLTEEPFTLDTGTRVLTMKTNGYSGELVIEIGCDNGIDTYNVVVEKNKTYEIEYVYDFTDRDNNWESYIWGGLTLNSKSYPVSIQGGDYSSYGKLTANTFNKGRFSMSEK